MCERERERQRNRERERGREREREREREELHNIAVSPRVGELFCLKPGAKRWCDRSCGARRPATVEMGWLRARACVCV